MQFRKMALGSPLLSITKNAAEWLAALNDSVTLFLSFVANVLNGDTENYDLIHCPFTNRHETALLPYPISNTAPYASLVLNATPRTALPYPPEGTTMNVGQLRSI